MSGIRIVRDYPHPPAKVWRALTEPDLIARWGMRPEGFAPLVGTRFRFVAKPNPGWRGFVECEVLEVRPPSLLRYSWVGNEKSPTTHVAFRLEPARGRNAADVRTHRLRGRRRVLPREPDHEAGVEEDPRLDIPHGADGPRRRRSGAGTRPPPRL